MIGSAGMISIGVFAAPTANGHLPPYVYVLRFLPSLLVAAGPRIQELVDDLLDEIRAARFVGAAA